MTPVFAALRLGPAGWWGVAAALALGALAFWFYRRQLDDAGTVRRALLPTLRALAIVAIALMIAQPSLFQSRTFTQRGQVLVLQDASASMDVTDQQATPSHKLLSARFLKLTDTSDIDWTLADLADRLRRLRFDAQAALAETSGQAADAGSPADYASLLARETADIGDGMWTLDPALVGAAEVQGSAMMETWRDIPGRRLADVEREQVFARAPDERAAVASLRLPANAGDNFLRRVRGRLHPSETGSYVFHLAVDTSAELLVGSDESREGLRPVLQVPLRTDPDDLSAVSQPMRLEAGRAYAFELRHKEGDFDDHLTLAWSRDGATPRVIEKADLSAPGGLVDPDARRDELARRFAEQVVEPAAALRDVPSAEREAAARQVLDAMSESETRLLELFDAMALDLMARGQAQAVAAAAAFDTLTRGQRAQYAVEPAAGRAGLAETLAREADVEIRRVAAAAATPQSPASSMGTDLAGALTDVQPSDDRPQAVVLLSDGRHNTGPAPAEAAASLGRRGVAVHSLLMGSSLPPADLTVLEVVGPAAVHRDDQVTGRIILMDAMPPGSSFDARIMDGDTTLWEKTLQTTGRGRREIEFSFKVEEAAQDHLPAGPGEAKFNEILLPLRVEADVVSGEMQAQNNVGDLPVRVTLGTGRLLVVDGRPRWDSRYIVSLLGRDKRWEVRDVLGPDADGQTLPRGPGGIPSTREELFEYDVIALGEVPVEWWRGEELQWLADFVDERGGGLIVIDGMREMLRDYSGTPLEGILPVERTEAPPVRVARFELTDLGASRDALRLEPEAARNAQLWAGLAPPRWIMPASPLPGSEVLLEAILPEGERLPAIVARQVGRGRVWYQAFDETWRWRKDAENRWQSRYWSGLANHIMEPPFAVEDERVALGVEQAAVELGEKIGVRARLRDDQGRPISGEAATSMTASAVLLRNGAPVAEALLTPDASGGGLFRTDIAAPRDPGAYEVAVTTDHYPAGRLSARAGVLVRGTAASGELARLDADETLMQGLAEASGGRFLREHQAGELPELFAGLSRSQTVTSEYDLWTSWPLFGLAVVLLGTEWLIRRRTGML